MQAFVGPLVNKLICSALIKLALIFNFYNLKKIVQIKNGSQSKCQIFRHFRVKFNFSETRLYCKLSATLNKTWEKKGFLTIWTNLYSITHKNRSTHTHAVEIKLAHGKKKFWTEFWTLSRSPSLSFLSGQQQRKKFTRFLTILTHNLLTATLYKEIVHFLSWTAQR